jgi:DNA polymerase-2
LAGAAEQALASTRNAMMYNDYGLEGVFELARVSGLPVQVAARNSPGAGITAMQMIVALRQGILVPYQKQQTEGYKSAQDLIRLDQGGIVYQPVIGLHQDVGEIDFISMYPSIMRRFNISPENMGPDRLEEAAIQGLDEALIPEQPGLLPQTSPRSSRSASRSRDSWRPCIPGTAATGLTKRRPLP